jgi:hypothetical protein
MQEESQQPDSTPPKAKSGPKGPHDKWGTIVKEGIIVGRDRRVVPPDEIEHLASLGCTDREICDYFKINDNTLRYNFDEYLVAGRQQLKTSLRRAQLRLALESLNPTMLIWLGKNYLQQNEAGTTNDDVRALPWTDDVDDEPAQTLEDSLDAEDRDA